MQPRVSDICLGNGTSGPFPLSWNHILPQTESVTVNGLPQVRGLDYTLDTDSGAITFTSSLGAHSAAEVTYEPDPIQAQRNGDGRTIPLSVDLLRGEHGYFSFNALGKQNTTASSDLTLGLGMGLQGAHNSQLTSRFFYTPVTAINGTNADSDKRLGVSVAGSTTASNWALFSFGFARAGVGLQNAGDDSPAAGQQAFTLSSRLTPTKTMQAQVNFSQSKPTDDPNAQTTKTTSVALTSGRRIPKPRWPRTSARARLERAARPRLMGLTVDANPTAKAQSQRVLQRPKCPRHRPSDTSGDQLKNRADAE